MNNRILGSPFSNLSCPYLVYVGYAAHEGTLQVAKGIGTDTAYVQVFPDMPGQQVTQSTGAGQLNVAVSILFYLVCQLGNNGYAVFVLYSFGYSYNTTAVFIINLLYIF